MQITQINNIYSLIAFIILIVVAVSIIITIIILVIKKIGKLSVKKGDIEVSIDNQKEKIIEKVVEVNKNKREKSLSEHIFFIEMEKWAKHDINKIKIDSENKKIIVTNFLRIKFNTFQKLLKDYIINAEQILSINNDYKCDDIIGLFLKGIEDYNNEAKVVEIRIGNRIMKGIPETFIKKFDEWHTPHIEIVTESIKNIINNEIYADEYIKLVAILEVFYIAFRLTILDAMYTLNNLNGELDKEIEERLCGI